MYEGKFENLVYAQWQSEQSRFRNIELTWITHTCLILQTDNTNFFSFSIFRFLLPDRMKKKKKSCVKTQCEKGYSCGISNQDGTRQHQKSKNKAYINDIDSPCVKDKDVWINFK